MEGMGGGRLGRVMVHADNLFNPVSSLLYACSLAVVLLSPDLLPLSVLGLGVALALGLALMAEERRVLKDLSMRVPLTYDGRRYANVWELVLLAMGDEHMRVKVSGDLRSGRFRDLLLRSGFTEHYASKMVRLLHAMGF